MTRVRGMYGSAALLGSVTAACCLPLVACLGTGPEQAVSDARATRVEPRVVMDGAVELGQRAEDRIIVDEVVFHAPAVFERSAFERSAFEDGSERARDVLATDAGNPGPLLFRYDIASEDGFGDVLGGARSWVLHDDADDAALEFSFSPFAVEDSARARLEDAAGVDLEGLLGHTAYVHGYVLMSAQGAGFQTECDGDPDGNPADCTRADGDPDGNPAGPAPENDGDPDGNPAKPRSSDGEGDQSDDGSPADGDPDGNPAKPGRHGYGDELALHGTPFDDELITATRLPFVLLLNAPFSLSVPVAELLTAEVDVAGGEVLPIDLHIALSDLFSAERVGALKDTAATQQQGAVVLEVTDATAVGLGVHTAVVRKAEEAASAGGIRVVGDLR